MGGYKEKKKSQPVNHWLEAYALNSTFVVSESGVNQTNCSQPNSKAIDDDLGLRLKLSCLFLYLISSRFLTDLFDICIAVPFGHFVEHLGPFHIGLISPSSPRLCVRQRRLRQRHFPKLFILKLKVIHL